MELQESAELLTEEGALLADIQGDAVVDYDIDRYVSRLDEVRFVLYPKRVKINFNAMSSIDSGPESRYH